MTQTIQPQPSPAAAELPEQVLQAALRAWRISGEPCEVGPEKADAPGLFATVVAKQSRCIEYVFGPDTTDGTWEALATLPHNELWHRSALVPQSMLGKAREYLRDSAVSLQGWWIHNGRVSFGSAESA